MKTIGRKELTSRTGSHARQHGEGRSIVCPLHVKTSGGTFGKGGQELIKNEAIEVLHALASTGA